MRLSELQVNFACPECYADINPRVVDGKLRILCAGEGHDVAALGRAIPKAKRDYIVAKQEADAIDAAEGLKRSKIMPILDLQKRATARLKRAGIIRLGIKKTSARTGKEYPAATDYFVLRDAPDLIDIYGDKPTRLNVLLPFDEIDRNFPAWHQLWSAGGLVCQGNGEFIDYAVSPQTGEVLVRDGRALISNGLGNGIKITAGEPVACPGLDHSYSRCKNCRPRALLVVIIPEMGRLAYYQVATGSIHNIINLTGQMRWYQERIGRLQGIPFVLELRAESISTPSGEGGKRARREKYLLSLETHPEYVQAMLKEMSARALPGGPPVAQLTAPAQDAPAESVDFAEDDAPVWENADFDDDPELDETPQSTSPTLDDIEAAMLAVGPSGDPLGKFDRLVWGRVANAKGDKYSDDLKGMARLLFENQALVQQWRNERGEALDEMASQDAPLDEEIPPEAH
jgi:hypothetical protein